MISVSTWCLWSFGRGRYTYDLSARGASVGLESGDLSNFSSQIRLRALLPVLEIYISLGY